MTLEALMSTLAAAGVDMAVEGVRVRLSGPPGTLTPALRQAITDHKPALIESLTGYRQLDAAIIASEADRRSLTEIEARLARVTDRAGAPDCTALDRQLVRDWAAIRAAKIAGRNAA